MAKKEDRTKKKKRSPRTSYRMVRTKALTANPLNKELFGKNDTGYDELRSSIRKNGFLPQHPLIVFKGNVIGCGFRRWMIAHDLKIKRVPVIYNPIPPDSDEAQQIMIEDNIYRPKQYRHFSGLERYMFFLKLDSLDSIERKRGGDRRVTNSLRAKKTKNIDPSISS